MLLWSHWQVKHWLFLWRERQLTNFWMMIQPPLHHQQKMPTIKKFSIICNKTMMTLKTTMTHWMMMEMTMIILPMKQKLFINLMMEMTMMTQMILTMTMMIQTMTMIQMMMITHTNYYQVNTKRSPLKDTKKYLPKVLPLQLTIEDEKPLPSQSINYTFHDYVNPLNSKSILFL